MNLGPWASWRRQELLELLDRLGPGIEELDAVVKAEAERRSALPGAFEAHPVNLVLLLAAEKCPPEKHKSRRLWKAELRYLLAPDSTGGSRMFSQPP